MAESSRSVKQPERRRYSADAYTVAWICALPVPEWKASRHMFDEEHLEPKLRSSHQHQYVYGKINGHAVVMGSCPVETMGNEPSAALMSEMISIFKNLQFAVLVGIAGGVWTPNQDIRLGDVVVSIPSRDPTNGGVLQYDFGKQEPDGPPKLMGHIKGPGLTLLSGVGKLRSARPGESRFEEYLSTYSTYNAGYDDSQPFKRPDSEDVLYTSVFETNAKAAEQIVERKSRNHTRSEVHYGLIATGNLVIKDAVKRDEIIRQLGHDVMAFEMEAAGVMNQKLSCLVIRGICDYCDHRKKKEWQPYAAAAAAAWTKELLRNITPQDAGMSLVVRSASPVIQEQDTWLANVGKQLTKSNKSTDKSKRKAELLMKRISQYDAATTLLCWSQRRLENTTQWIFRQSEFDAWIEQAEPGILLLTGTIGSGKTIAMASIVDHLKATQSYTAILHYFVKDNGISPLDVFRSFTQQILQILQQRKKPFSSSTIDLLDRAFGDENRVPDAPALIHSILVPLIKDVQGVIVCLDGIDTFDIRSQRELLDNIAIFNSKLIVSCRGRLPLRTRPSQVVSTISMNAEDNKEDIGLYIDKRFRCLHVGEVSYEKPFWQQLKANLLDKAKGMFLWVRLQLDLISECDSQEEIMNSTNDLPEELDKLFRRCLLLKHRGKLLCHSRILKWAAAALEPPNIDQIREMVELDDGSAKVNRIDIERGGVNLLVIQHDETVVPIHDVVRQFLFDAKFQNDIRPDGEFSDMIFQALATTREDAILDIAHLSLKLIQDSCIGTMVERHTAVVPSPKLLLPSFTRRFMRSRSPAPMINVTPLLRPKARTSTEFLKYAIGTWTEHTKGISSAHESWHLFKDIALRHDFMQPVHPWETDDDRKHATDNTHLRGLLGYAVAHNHKPLLLLVLEHSQLPREVFDRPLPQNDYLPPLLVAAAAGYQNIVSILLQICNINIGMPQPEKTALYYALLNRHSAVAELLLECNIDYMLWPEDERSALHLAAEAGLEEIVHALLKKGMKDSGVLPFSDSTEVDKCTAVRCAAQNGHIDTVKLLITSDSSYDFNGALLVAALQSQAEIMNYLLDQASETTWTAGRKQDLQAIMLSNFSEVRAAVTNMIIAKEGDIFSLLSYAARYGDVTSVRLLIGNGASTEAIDNALGKAVEWQKLEVVQLLIDKGASAEAIDKALVAAAEWQKLEIAQLLIDKGASAEAIDKALIVTACVKVAQLLIDKDASAEAIDKALEAAARWGRLEIAQLLIDKGASAEAIDKALEAAARWYRLEIAELLIDKGASAEAIDKALLEATAVVLYQSSLAIAQLLIEKGASAEAIDKALVKAARYDSLEIAQLLIDKGASADAIDRALEDAKMFTPNAMMKFLKDKRFSARRTVRQGSEAR